LSRSWLIVPLLILYLLDLGGVGFLGPDEPRYASIGREMARTHDFVTPRLDGQPWFEKPPLLYWMIVAGRATHLSDEWAARLPVALLSIGFLIFFFVTMMREFSPRAAIASATMLATMAGWLGFSFVAVTDLPMAATFWAAMLIAMFDTRRDQGYLAGALLGLSVLAKGLVPLALFVPVFLIARGKRLTMLAGCIVVGAPWYALVWMRNGRGALDELIWKHHFERFFSTSLQHVQPIWYYAPIVLAGLFPWTPMFGLLFRRKTYDDVRVRFLIAWLIYAFVFFSLSVNKLPGYALPMLPALAIVFAVGVDKTGAAMKWWMIASSAMLVILPTIVRLVPDALLAGLRKAPIIFAPGIPFILATAVVAWLAWRDRPNLAVLGIGMTVLFATAYVKGVTFAEIDQRVSVRGFWRAHQMEAASACWENVRREWVYGLNYYADRQIPACSSENSTRIVEEHAGLTLKQP
jgi:4-amino-4-deoxy-L-arabinose transferase-like glycosyltransferase